MHILSSDQFSELQWPRETGLLSQEEGSGLHRIPEIRQLFPSSTPHCPATLAAVLVGAEACPPANHSRYYD